MPPIPLALTILAVALANQQVSTPRPVHDAGTNGPASPLSGVWREMGYGRVLAIGEKGFDLYHETKILCYRDGGVVDARLDSRYSLYELSPDGATLTLYFHDLGKSTRHFQNHQRFERLPSLPAGCVPSLKGSRFERPESSSTCSGRRSRTTTHFSRSVEWTGSACGNSSGPVFEPR